MSARLQPSAVRPARPSSGPALSAALLRGTLLHRSAVLTAAADRSAPARQSHGGAPQGHGTSAGPGLNCGSVCGRGRERPQSEGTGSKGLEA